MQTDDTLNWVCQYCGVENSVWVDLTIEGKQDFVPWKTQSCEGIGSGAAQDQYHDGVTRCRKQAVAQP